MNYSCNEKKFYKKGTKDHLWHCLCDRFYALCTNPKCIEEGDKLGLKVGCSICEHGTRRARCIKCKGTSMCPHNRRKANCIHCEPENYMLNTRRSRRNTVFRKNYIKCDTHSLEDLCMDTKKWKTYLYTTFENTYGRQLNKEDKVHIDEIIPCRAWNLPEDNKYCWHYLNSQLLIDVDNMEKSYSYTEEEKHLMKQKIDQFFLAQKLSLDV